MARDSRCQSLIFACLLTGALAAGCASDTAGSVPSEPATLAASQTTHSTFGIASWQTYTDATSRWIIALNDEGEQVARLRVVSQDDDRLGLRISSDQSGDEVLALDRRGTISGPGEQRYRALATALYSDAQAGSFLPRETAEATSTLTGPSLQWEKSYSRSGGLFGDREDFTDGPANGCGGVNRLYYNAYVASGSGNCAVTRWTSDDPSDCRVQVHIGVGAFGWELCTVQVYVDR